MPDKYEGDPSEWFGHGDKDLRTAKILIEHHGFSDNVAFFLQQASEKYLKGYLLSKGWKLQKTHDLEVLISEAAKYDKTFKDFLDFAQIISALYVESRYPLGPPKEYSQKEISDWLQHTEKIISKIKEAMK